MRDDKERAILEAATQVFIRYGYRRTKMADIAEEAKMSRPALYLVFENKEAIFRGVVELMMDDALARIREELPRHRGLKAKLLHAFEVWTIEPYELVSRAPDADELIERGHDFALDVYEKGTKSLQALLVEVIEAERGRGTKLDAHQTAELLTSAVGGFKTSAKSTRDLRRLVEALVTVCLR